MVFRFLWGLILGSDVQDVDWSFCLWGFLGAVGFLRAASTLKLLIVVLFFDIVTGMGLSDYFRLGLCEHLPLLFVLGLLLLFLSILFVFLRNLLDPEEIIDV